MTSRSRSCQQRRLRERDERRERSPRPVIRPRARWLPWSGVLLQPVGVLLVLMANGLLADPHPRVPERQLLLPITVLALLGLVPVVVTRARAGGWGSVVSGTLLWSFAQCGTGLVSWVVVRVIAGQDWAEEAVFSGFVGLLGAAAWLAGCLLWFAGGLLINAVRLALHARAPGDLGPVLLLGAVGVALLATLALGVGAAGSGTAPTGGRRLGAVLLAIDWALSTAEPGPWVWTARVSAAALVVTPLVGFAGAWLTFWRWQSRRGEGDAVGDGGGADGDRAADGADLGR